MNKEDYKRITILETNYGNVMDKLDEFQKQNIEAHKDIMAAVIAMENKLDIALEKKAGKWVETVIYWFAKIIGGGLITFLGYQIVKLINIQ